MTDDELFTQIANLKYQRQLAEPCGDTHALKRHPGSSQRYIRDSSAIQERPARRAKQTIGLRKYQNPEPIHSVRRRFGDTVVINGDLRFHVSLQGTEKDFASRYLPIRAQEMNA